MTNPPTASRNYLSGLVRKRDRLIFVASPAASPNQVDAVSSLFIHAQGRWTENSDFSGVYGFSCIIEDAATPFCAARADGSAVLIGPEDGYVETIPSAERGPLRRLRAIAGLPFAIGMMRQVYRRDGADTWTRIDTPAMARCTGVTGFETIDGFSLDDIYCAGWGGEIWHFDGHGWKRIDCPSNLILTDCCCAPDGQVYLCGQMGLILRGRGSSWEVIDHGGPKLTWWNCCWYQEKLWVASDLGLYTLEDGKLERVDFEIEEPDTFMHLSTGDGVLLSTGAKDALLFDGDAWTRID